jgi:hypothetical protein
VSKPTLADISAKSRAAVLAQLRDTPHPRTVAVAPAEDPPLYAKRTGPNSARFLALLSIEGIPAPVAEYRFALDRRWRFDWAWPDQLIALEVEGGVWSGGRHTRGAGFAGDIEKYNRAALAGWRVLRCQPRTLCTRATVEMLRAVMETTQ